VSFLPTPRITRARAPSRSTREKLGLSQEQLGFESGLDRTYISGIERGVRNPTMRILLRLGEALDVKPSTLMRRAESE